MNINKLTFLLVLSSISGVGIAQEISNDSLYQEIESVVITGQFEPQSIKKSVHNVRVISKDDIQNLAANNLGDVLNQYLNITVTPNGETGRSSISLFGLDSQYFKILVDNIPLVSDTGLGNEVDLSQINLDDVERIEIIEGAMGVTHGANAVSGVLNIITKKSSVYEWEISASIQEETVGSEYRLFDRGRHIQNIKISHNISEHWFTSVGANRNDLKGFYNDRKGKDYAINDGDRGTDWLPKEQFTTTATLGYQKNNSRFFYKFDYFNETVEYYNPIVIPYNNHPFPNTYFSNDKRLPTNRFVHHINYYGKLFSDLIFNISVSHQKQQREEETFNYHILEREERNKKEEVYHSNEVLYSTGTVTNFIKNNERFDFQLGYELVNENSFANATSGMFKDDQQQAVNVRKRIENYDFYALSEINVTERFSLRPGLRYSFQSIFDNQLAYSLAARYLLNHDMEARLSGGKSYRTPNFSELYTYFVDSNHDVRGNPELTPEQSTYIEANFKKYTYFDSGVSLHNGLTAGYMEVDDKISMLLLSYSPILQYQYINVNQYKMWNLSTDNRIRYKDFNFSAGFSLIGISQQIRTGGLGTTSDDKFLYTFNFNAAASYNIPKWNTQLSLYFKHNGKVQQFVTDANDSSKFVLSEIDPFNWLDASVKKTFFDGKIELMVGARNILNTTEVMSTTSTTGIGSGAHVSSTNRMMLGYGRSYFLKLTYNLNF